MKSERIFPSDLSIGKEFFKLYFFDKKVDLSPYLYTDKPENFEGGIGRLWLIREKSAVWNEK